MLTYSGNQALSSSKNQYTKKIYIDYIIISAMQSFVSMFHDLPTCGEINKTHFRYGTPGEQTS